MKQSRRHELKTNELSVWLKQTYASAGRNANYLLGGLVVVALILVVAVFVRNRRSDARESAWNRYFELGNIRTKDKPEVMEQVRAFAAQQQGSSELGLRALVLLGEKAADLAMVTDPTKEPSKHSAALKEARDAYTQVIQQADADSPLIPTTRLALAAVLESLTLRREATVADVRAQFDALKKLPEKNLYRRIAERMESSLDERLRPLELAATRPAEPPASAPAEAPSLLPPPVPAAESLPAPVSSPASAPASAPAP